MSEEEFIGHAIKEMVENEVTVLFNKRTNNSKHSANYFSTEKPNKPTFIINYFDASLDFEIFLHEYCHFLQWKKKDEFWDQSIKSLNHFYEWLEGRQKKCDKKHLINIQMLELDADRKVVRLINKHKFNINLTKYITESNSYAMTYQYVWKHRDMRKFPINYNADEIMQMLPDKHLTKKDLTKDYTELMQLYAKFQ
jgi:hypothetical protein